MEESSWIRRMFELGLALKEERGPENIFDLSLGNPVMEPPEEFFLELKELAETKAKGMHRYMPNAGYPETRQAVAEQLALETGIPYKGANIMMSVGAGGAINVAIHALVDQGDEVIVFAPYFAEYIFYAHNHYAVPVVVHCNDFFVPDLTDLERKLTPRTKCVLLNSPNNPAGVVYNEEFLKELASLLELKAQEFGTEIFIISDEPYRKLIFDKAVYPFPQHFYQRTITVTSHSKDLALPGERIGYLAVHPSYPSAEELMDAMIFCNRVLGFVNAPAIMQHAVKALQNITIDIGEYQIKRDFLYNNLKEIGYQVVLPHGAFYMFPKSPINDELQFIDMLQNEGVLVVPGRGFGMAGYFRISYCVEQNTLEGAIKGFKIVAERLGLKSS